MTVPDDSEYYVVLAGSGGTVHPPEGGFLNEEGALGWAQLKVTESTEPLYVAKVTRTVTQVVSPQVTVVTQTAAEARAGQ